MNTYLQKARLSVFVELSNNSGLASEGLFVDCNEEYSVEENPKLRVCFQNIKKSIQF